MIYNIGQKCGALFCGHACNAYLIKGDKNILIDGVEQKYAQKYFDVLKKYINLEDIDCIIFTSTAPWKTGILCELIKLNKQIPIYASVAGLRNIKEQLNTDFNGIMCKNYDIITRGKEQLQISLIPNVTWPDSLIIFDKVRKVAFSGEILSYIGCPKDAQGYFDKYIRPVSNSWGYALDILKAIKPQYVYPFYGDTPGVYSEKIISAKPCDLQDKILIVYASHTGNNHLIAQYIKKYLTFKDIEADLINVCDKTSDVSSIDFSLYKGFIFGTYTDNRTMPDEMIDFVKNITVSSVIDKPYFTFGSYGWSNEGVYMLNELIGMLKMRRVEKMITSIFTPDDVTYDEIRAAVDLLIQKINKGKEEI